MATPEDRTQYSSPNADETAVQTSARPSVSARPAMILYAILSAGKVWLLAALLVVGMIVVVRPAITKAVDTAFPPKPDHKFLGLVKKDKQKPIARAVYGVFMLTAWLGVAGVVVIRLRRYYPDGLVAAERRSRRWEEQADTHLTANWLRSRRYYRGARLLTADPARAARLQQRIASLGTSSRFDPMPTDRTSEITALNLANVASRTNSVGPGDRYSLDQKLGEGAMGVVYRGRDSVLDRAVAVKQLSHRLVGDGVYAERFMLEARSLARLSHPHIVQVYDFVEAGGSVWMVLEFVEGGTLADLLKREGRLKPSEAAAMIAALAEGLAAAHAVGIIHRDIKPANILLASDRQPKLSDFGIAKLASASTLTQAGATLGSPAYMSPEQCNGEPLDERSDIYSLGITLYELLAGRPPFAGDTAGILAQHLVAPPNPPSKFAPGIPEDLERVVLRMLAKKREERLPSMREVGEKLRPFAAAVREGALA